MFESGAMARILGLAKSFEGRPVDREIIVLSLRWYLDLKLSSRDLVERMAERGLSMPHTTNTCWGAPLAAELKRR